jgi:hypothetical protein
MLAIIPQKIDTHQFYDIYLLWHKIPELVKMKRTRLSYDSQMLTMPFQLWNSNGKYIF